MLVLKQDFPEYFQVNNKHNTFFIIDMNFLMIQDLQLLILTTYGKKMKNQQLNQEHIYTFDYST